MNLVIQMVGKDMMPNLFTVPKVSDSYPSSPYPTPRFIPKNNAIVCTFIPADRHRHFLLIMLPEWHFWLIFALINPLFL